MSITITVFTPTYNRCGLLVRCYHSLQKQSCKDFVWLIVDDGSTDGTGSVVSEWIEEEKSFEIDYIWKENGGLHTAYNKAIEQINTTLCVCIDSDDWMPEDAIEIILKTWEKRGSENVAGIVGLDCYEDGRVIGDLLPEQDTVNLIDLLIGKYNINNGDRTNVVRTAVYRQFAPMKSFPGERFFSPHYMHIQISRKYDFLVLNKCLRFVEYQPDGLSASILHQYKNSPRSFIETRKLYLSLPESPLSFRLRNSIHLASSCYLSGNILASIKINNHKCLAVMSLPFGFALGLYIQYCVK